MRSYNLRKLLYYFLHLEKYRRRRFFSQLYHLHRVRQWTKKLESFKRMEKALVFHQLSSHSTTRWKLQIGTWSLECTIVNQYSLSTPDLKSNIQQLVRFHTRLSADWRTTDHKENWARCYTSERSDNTRNLLLEPKTTIKIGVWCYRKDLVSYNTVVGWGNGFKWWKSNYQEVKYSIPIHSKQRNLSNN